MHKISIRQFRPHDARTVSSLIRTTLLEVNAKDYPHEIIQSLCEHYAPNRIIERASNQLMYVAVAGHRIVGTVSLQDDTILTLFVHPQFHGKGIGTQLIDYIEAVARTRGYKRVNVSSSITAYAFYEQRGYMTVSETCSEDYGQTIIMEKRL